MPTLLEGKIKKKYKNYKYGIGIEHEMYIVHFPLKPSSQKITYMILAPTEGYQNLILNNQEKLSEKDLKLIKSIPYEPTGRICNGKTALKSLPGSWSDKERMPEFITDEPISTIGKKEKKMYQYSKQLEGFQESYTGILNKYLDINLRQKADTYGTLLEPPFGMSSYIKTSENYRSKKYKLRPKLYKDYCGSYHITLTLPYKKNMKLSKFIDIHKNFANMIQWIEPLMITAFFSADDKSMGTSKKKVRGSYRVVRTGWGNLAGSDVRKLDSGIGRYSNIPSYWRKGLIFDEQKMINYCKDLSPALKKREPGAKAGFSSNFRTFGSTDPERPEHRESGIGMTIGNGIELRIFDHFPIKYLNSLLQLVSLIAENSRVHKCTDYVYKNKAWIHAVKEIMKHGWCAKLTTGFKNKLRKMLDIPLATSSLVAYDIMKTVYKELYDKNHKGDYYIILVGDNKKYIELPKINRKSFEFGLSMKLNNNKSLFKNTNRFIKKIENTHDIEKIKKNFYKIFSKKNWDNCFYQFMFYLETLGVLKLEIGISSNIIAIYKFKNIITFHDINSFIAHQFIDRDTEETTLPHL